MHDYRLRGENPHMFCLACRSVHMKALFAASLTGCGLPCADNRGAVRARVRGRHRGTEMVHAPPVLTASQSQKAHWGCDALSNGCSQIWTNWLVLTRLPTHWPIGQWSTFFLAVLNSGLIGGGSAA